MTQRVAEMFAPSSMGAALMEMAVATVFLIVGVSFLTDPATAARSPVGQGAHPFDTVWAVLYVVACPLIVTGIVRRYPRWRVPGLLLLATGLLMQGLAGAVLSTDIRTLCYFIYCGACVARALLIFRLSHSGG